jgi:hypothetical protein
MPGSADSGPLGSTAGWLQAPGIRLLAGLFLLLVAQSGCAGQAPAHLPFRLEGDLPISAPASISAGESIPVTVGPVTSVDGTPVTLVVVGSYGPRVYEGVLAGGRVQFTIPASDTMDSGVVDLLVAAEDAQASAQILVQPGPPVEPVTPLVGARSIVADGEHWSMTVVVPFDQFGNPVAEGTPVQIRAQHPGDRLEELVVPVEHLLAWERIFSGTKAGRTTIAVQTGGAFGPDANLEEVPGWPIPFSLSAEPGPLPADGRHLVTLRTDTLRDRFGNVVPDGTLVTFVVQEGASGLRRSLPGYTLGGIAEVPLQAPLEPGVLQVVATVFDVASLPLQVAFTAGPAVGTFPLVAQTASDEDSLLLVGGPMLGPLEQYIPDGTPVLFQVQGEVGYMRWIESIAEAGYASARLRLVDLAPGTYRAWVFAGSGKGETEFSVPEKGNTGAS